MAASSDVESKYVSRLGTPHRDATHSLQSKARQRGASQGARRRADLGLARDKGTDPIGHVYIFGTRVEGAGSA
eukprot:1141841-Pleurochrysis_carterae.AAC.1